MERARRICSHANSIYVQTNLTVCVFERERGREIESQRERKKENSEYGKRDENSTLTTMPWLMLAQSYII